MRRTTNLLNPTTLFGRVSSRNMQRATLATDMQGQIRSYSASKKITEPLQNIPGKAQSDIATSTLKSTKKTLCYPVPALQFSNSFATMYEVGIGVNNTDNNFKIECSSIFREKVKSVTSRF